MQARGKYTKEMATAVRKVKKPYPMTIHIVEWDNGFVIRFFEDEVMKYSQIQHISIIKYLCELQEVIKSFGYECELGGVKGGPR